MPCRSALDRQHVALRLSLRLIGVESAPTASSSLRSDGRRKAVIMWRELVKRANTSWIFQEDEDMYRTRCNRHAEQPSTGSTCAWCQHVAVSCACVDKIYRGPAESNIAQCANRRFLPPFLLCPLHPSIAEKGATRIKGFDFDLNSI